MWCLFRGKLIIKSLSVAIQVKVTVFVLFESYIVCIVWKLHCLYWTVIFCGAVNDVLLGYCSSLWMKS